MKLWVDDIKAAPEGYVWCKSIYEVIKLIESIDDFHNTTATSILAIRGFFNVRESDGYIHNWEYSSLSPPKIELIDIDHDVGDFTKFGGDYIHLLDWLEETGRSYPIHIHFINSISVENMRRSIKKNGWVEIR